MFLGMFVRLGEKSDIAARARHAEREIDIVLETAGKKKGDDCLETRQTHSELPPKLLANGVCTCRFG
jgi:hypothetical protein